jgi:hypothetical protein
MTDKPIPHLALPFRWGQVGGAVQLEQDTDEEITNCVELTPALPSAACKTSPTSASLVPPSLCAPTRSRSSTRANSGSRAPRSAWPSRSPATATSSTSRSTSRRDQGMHDTVAFAISAPCTVGVVAGSVATHQE